MRREHIEVAAAILAGIVGLVVYLVDRDPERVYLLAWSSAKLSHWHLDLGAAGGFLPEFIHVYVFILLTAAVLPAQPRYVLVSSIGWLVLDGAFELAQHPVFAPAISASTSAWLADLPLVENTAAYFRSGTFDVLDLAAVAAGTAAAWVTAEFATAVAIRSAGRGLAAPGNSRRDSPRANGIVSRHPPTGGVPCVRPVFPWLHESRH